MLKILRRIPDSLLVTGGALGIRLLGLGGERLWYDEAFTAWSSKPKTDLWGAVLGDTHPPLWPVIEALNVRLFGFSEFSFRLPSALFGAGVVLLLFLIAKRLGFERKTALTVGMVAAAMPGLLYFSQDARMYSALAFFVLLTLYAALRTNWYLFAVGAIGAVYTQNVGLFYVAAIGGSALILTKDRVELAKRLMALGVVGVTYLGWLPNLLDQMNTVKGGFWPSPLTFSNTVWPFAVNVIGWRIPAALDAPIYTGMLAFTGVSLYNARRWMITRPGLVVIAAAFGAPALIAAFSVAWTNVYIARVILPSTSLIALWWGYSLNHLSKRNRQLAAAAVLPMIAIGLAAHYFPWGTRGREDLTAWMQPISDEWQAADVVYYTNTTSAIGYTLYIGEKPYATLPSRGDVIQATDRSRAAFGINYVPFDALAAQGFKRAWVIVNYGPFMPQSEIDALQDMGRAYDMKAVKTTVVNEIMRDSLYLVALREPQAVEVIR